MFLKQVYKHNKWLCLVMILFIAGQLFVNFKRGMVVSPFFHYGMYSHRINVEKGYPVVEVTVNGKQLRGQDFTAQQWDKILLPIQYHSNIGRSNRLYENEVKRLLGRLHISANEKDFLQKCNEESFENWYTVYLASFVGQPVQQLQINERMFAFNGQTLIPTDSIQSLAQLCHRPNNIERLLQHGTASCFMFFYCTNFGTGCCCFK